MKKEITREDVLQLLHYDPDTGIFTRHQLTGGRGKLGPAGCENPKGYWHIRILGQQLKAHRLAWFCTYGVWPNGPIDHMDGNKKNNAIANLRDATAAINSQNLRRAQKRSSTGLLGVYPKRNRWRAKIQVAGKCHELGLYDTAEEAHAAYLEAKRKHHEGCTL